MALPWALVVEPNDILAYRAQRALEAEGLAVRRTSSAPDGGVALGPAGPPCVAVLRFSAPTAEAAALCGWLVACTPRPTIMALCESALVEACARHAQATIVLRLPVETDLLKCALAAVVQGSAART